MPQNKEITMLEEIQKQILESSSSLRRAQDVLDIQARRLWRLGELMKQTMADVSNRAVSCGICDACISGLDPCSGPRYLLPEELATQHGWLLHTFEQSNLTYLLLDEKTSCSITLNAVGCRDSKAWEPSHE